MYGPTRPQLALRAHSRARRARSRAVLVALAIVSVTATACSDAESSGSTSGSTSAASRSTTTAGPRTRPACDRPVAENVVAHDVAGVPADHDVTSFDGTVIRAHWFPVGDTGDHPTVLMGPGWSQPGAVKGEDPILFGALSIAAMNDAGYNVLTWDPRGFGASTGVATVNDPDHEGRDVQALLDWVASQPGVRLDRPGDPRVGMVGASYGGGIQLVVAAIDCRVDVLVPTLAWHSLTTSLDRNATVKSGWAGILNSAASTFGGRLDPHVVSAATTGIPDGVLSQDDREWFASRGPGDLVDRVEVPTLFVQGTVDTLFTLDEGIENYESLRRRNVPTAMIWFCGGHGTCLTDEGDTTNVNDRSFAWLDRYLNGNESVATGPRFDLVDQTGARWTGPDYPPKAADPIRATGSGSLTLDADSAAGPVTEPRPGSADILSGVVLGITPAKAANAINVRIDPGAVDGLVVGPPKLRLDYTATAPTATTGAADEQRPARLFAQLVDDDTGRVIGNQVTPIEITADGKQHRVDVDLESVAFHVRPGHTVTLQLVATTSAYAVPRLGGSVEAHTARIELPVVAGMTPA